MDELPGVVNDGGYTLKQGLASVGEGWATIVRMAFALKPLNIKIVQVKEKFGGIRIYTDSYDEVITDASRQNDAKIYETEIRALERLAYITCEWCGKKGTMDNRYYWVLTLCTQCKRKRKRKLDAV